SSAISVGITMTSMTASELSRIVRFPAPIGPWGSSTPPAQPLSNAAAVTAGASIRSPDIILPRYVPASPCGSDRSMPPLIVPGLPEQSLPPLVPREGAWIAFARARRSILLQPGGSSLVWNDSEGLIHDCFNQLFVDKPARAALKGQQGCPIWGCPPDAAEC